MEEVKIPTFIKHTASGEVSFSFIPDTEFPKSVPFSTPLTFAVCDNAKPYLLVFDKNNYWNPICGHIERGETWQECLQREAIEEGGVEIRNFELKGYILAETKLGDSKPKYPPVTVLPVSISRIYKINTFSSRFETKCRQFFTRAEAEKVLRVRKDNLQMLYLFKYLFGN